MSGTTGTPPLAASDDCQAIAGWAVGSGTSFRWTPSVGFQNLGFLPGGSSASALDISGDGLVVVGRANTTGGTLHAFRWTSQDGMQSLNGLSGSLESEAWGVNTNGSAIVGTSEVSATSSPAFLWTINGGMQILGNLAGSQSTIAADVSSDGSVVVGYAQYSGGNKAFLWSGESGIEALPPLPSGVYSLAHAITADGLVIVGYSQSASGYHACRWIDGRPEDLGVPSGGINCVALDVSANGQTVGGRYSLSGNYRALLWHPSLGAVDLWTYLSSLGTNLSGWLSLEEVVGVSADGTTLVGKGKSTSTIIRVFIVTGLPLSGGTCAGDIAGGKNGGDGSVNINDLLAVINAWGACTSPCPPKCAADVNHDCAVNVQDLLAVIGNWGACQ